MATRTRAASLAAAALLLLLAASATAQQPEERPLYVGTACHEQGLAYYGCPLAGICATGVSDRCVLYAEGVFQYPASGWSPREPPFGCADAGDADGAFSADGVWKPFNTSCRLGAFDALDAWASLRGKSVVFAGDSLIRQMYMRFLALQRGMHANAQSFLFHNDAAYVRNASHDLLCTTSNLTLCHARLEESDADASLHARFLWQPLHLDVSAVLSGGPPDVAVIGLLFHVPHNDTLHWLLPALDAVMEGSHRTSLFWLATPKLGLHSFTARNDLMRAWAARTPRARVLGLDKLKADGRFPPHDGMHYTCSVHNGNRPEAQTVCADLEDSVNLNLVQFVLNDEAAWRGGGGGEGEGREGWGHGGRAARRRRHHNTTR